MSKSDDLSVSSPAAGRYAVSVLFTHRERCGQFKQQMRLSTFDATSEDEAIGKAIRIFRAGDVHPDAECSIELAVQLAARTQEDTQRERSEAAPTNERQTP